MAEDKDDKKPVPRGKDPESLMIAVNKYFKAEVGIMASETGNTSGVRYKYPTGILSLDKYLRIGGLLGGRILECYGHEGCGKTLTALTVAAQMQRTKVDHPSNSTGFGRVVFLDPEGTCDEAMARSVGVDTTKMPIFRSTPERILSGEDYFDLMNVFIQNGVELIIVDSVPSLQPGARIGATPGQGMKATHAQMMAEGVRNVETLLNAYQRPIVWFINQIRMKPMVQFGSPEGLAGGEKLKYAKTYSIEVRKVSDIVKDVPDGFGGFEKRRIGVTIKAKLDKNKTATIPMEPITFDVYFETVTDSDGLSYMAGVDVYKDVVETAINSRIIAQQSSWYSFGGVKANGKDAFIEQLRTSGPDGLVQEIRKSVLGSNS